MEFLPKRALVSQPVPGEFLAQRPVTRSFDVFLICISINGWVNNREAGDLRRHRAHYDVIVMKNNRVITASLCMANDRHWARSATRSQLLLPTIPNYCSDRGLSYTKSRGITTVLCYFSFGTFHVNHHTFPTFSIHFIHVFNDNRSMKNRTDEYEMIHIRWYFSPRSRAHSTVENAMA